ARARPRPPPRRTRTRPRRARAPPAPAPRRRAACCPPPETRRRRAVWPFRACHYRRRVGLELDGLAGRGDADTVLPAAGRPRALSPWIQRRRLSLRKVTRLA